MRKNVYKIFFARTMCNATVGNKITLKFCQTMTSSPMMTPQSMPFFCETFNACTSLPQAPGIYFLTMKNIPSPLLNITNMYCV